MTAPAHETTRWAIDLIDQLAAEGVRHATISPGSRSTPLALAADAHPAIATHVHIDERGAAYYALGIARATGRPAAIITTSGTAVANLLPACAEAHNDNVPLILLTADRPPRMRATGANQTMEQVGIFSHFVREQADLPVPDATTKKRMLTAVKAAARRAMAWPPGPVHLNQPFEKPIEPDIEGQEALRRLAAQRPRPPVAPVAPIHDGAVPDIEPRMLGAHGLIVCGPGTGAALADRIIHLGRALGAPVLADGLSGVRFGHATLGAYDHFLGAEAAALRPHYVIQFGRSPTSNALRRFLADQRVPRYRFDHSGRGWDDIGGDITFVACDPARWLDRLLQPKKDAFEHAGMHDTAPWLAAWHGLEQHALDVAAAALGDEPDVEPAWVPPVLEHARRLFVGNSMPVRDLDRFGHAPHAIDVAANRGVSGIDGTIATAAGWAVDQPAIAVIGDVAFQHDVGSLPLLPAHMRLVVVRNGGGRIFQHLPVSQATDRFDRLFLTPPQVDIETACAAFGLEAAAVSTSGLGEALRGTARIVIADVDGQPSVRWRQQIERRIRKDVADIIGKHL